jgi:Ser/Thr protein kinase RdoA (MazF antagonist)
VRGIAFRGVAVRAPAPSFDATLVRMFRRRGVETLPAHLEVACEISVSKVRQLDVGVFRVDRLHGGPVVARLFSARRADDAVHGDLAVLEQLQAAQFPAERPFDVHPVSTHDGQPVLVTEFVRKAAKSALPAGDPIAALGSVVGQLHRLEPTGAADRPAGALHHYAEGLPVKELRAARRWLRDIEPRLVDAAHRDDLGVLNRALADADDASGLPEGFVHPDPVPKNTVFTKDGPVLVDWTGAGRGPRLASLTLVLRSGWAGPRFMRGYATSIELDAEERSRLAGLLMARALIDITFRACREPAKLPQLAKSLDGAQNRIRAQAAAILAVT